MPGDPKKMKDAKKERTAGIPTVEKPIEYMQVTLKIPKACLMYLNEYVRTEAWLEDRLVKAVRTEYEVRSFGTWCADEMGLSPVFWELLKDKRFHPDIDKRVPMEPSTEEPKT